MKQQAFKTMTRLGLVILATNRQSLRRRRIATRQERPASESVIRSAMMNHVMQADRNAEDAAKLDLCLYGPSPYLALTAQ